MNDMELLIRLRDEVPAGAVSPRAEELFRAGLTTTIEAERAGFPVPRNRSGWPWALRPAWRLAVAAGLAVALGAGLVLGLPGRPSEATLTVQLLADRAAAAAGSGPSLPPGQWIYRKVSCGNYFDPLFWDVIACPSGTLDTWITADGTKVAVVDGGKLYVNSAAGYFRALHQPLWPPLAAYAARASLPADPGLLVARLGGYTGNTAADRAYSAFWIISQWLAFLVPSPSLTAELYRALADVPGVKIDKNAVDTAGRHGVGFTLAYPHEHGDATHGWLAVIVNPRTYQLLGLKAWDSTGRTIMGPAVLRQQPVSGPGIRP